MKNNKQDDISDVFQSIVENAVLGIFVVDVSNGNIVKTNDYGRKLFGYEEGELEGKEIEILVPTKHRHSHIEHHSQFSKNPVHRPMGVGLDVYGLKKDGTQISVEISLLPVKSGEKMYAVSFVSSIGELVQAEKSLKENEVRLSAVIDSAVDGIITINQRGIILTINAAVSRIFQHQSSEIIGENIKILMPEPRKLEHDNYLKNYKQSGKRQIIGIGREVIGKRKDGTHFPIYLSISEAKVHNETIFTGILHDLTDRKNAERAELDRSRWLEDYAENLEKEVAARTAALRSSQLRLRDALKKERELNYLKSRFVSMASHEFRTPLSTVLSSTELVEMYLEVNNTEKISKNISRIKTSVDHLNSILNDFLSLEKVETGKIEYKPDSFLLSDFIEEVLEDIKSTFQKGQNVVVTLTGSDTLKSDPFLLKNILFNLISNAVKYSPEGKDIFLNVENNKKELTLKVKDQGIGIPEEEKKNMFTRFFRASNVENIKGTGIGLTIVKRYTELMHGEIDFVSKLGEGTEFTVFIRK